MGYIEVGGAGLIVTASAKPSLHLWDIAAKKVLHQVNIGIYPTNITVLDDHAMLLECSLKERKCLSVWSIA